MSSIRLFIKSVNHKKKLLEIIQSVSIRNNKSFNSINTVQVPSQKPELYYFQNLTQKLKKYNLLYKKDIEMSLKRISPTNVNEASFLLECFGKKMPDQTSEEKRNLIEQLVICLENNGFLFSISNYNSLLKSLVENGSFVALSDWTDKLRAKSLSPNLETLNLLLTSAANHGDFRAANEIIEKIKSDGHLLTSSFYDKLVQTAASSGEKLWKDMIASLRTLGFVPSQKTYVAVLLGLSKKGDMKQIQELRKKVNELKEINLEDAINIIETLEENNHIRLIDDILEWLQPTDNKEDRKFLLQVAMRLILKGHLEMAEKFLTFACKENLRVEIGYDLLQEMVYINRPIKELTSLCSYLFELEKEKSLDFPSFHPISRIVYTSYCSQNFKMAEALLNAWADFGYELRPHFFWPLLIGKSKTGGESALLHLLNAMLERNVQIDFETLVDYVFPHLRLHDPFIQLRQLRNALPNLSFRLICNASIAHFLINEKPKEAMQVVQTCPTKLNPENLIKPLSHFLNLNWNFDICLFFLKEFQKSYPNVDWTGRLLLNLAHNKNFQFNVNAQDFKEFCQTLNKLNLSISPVNSEKLFKTLGPKAKILPINWDLKEFTTNFMHPQDMNTKQLESHKIELESKKMNSRGVTRKLLLNYCREGDLKNATKCYQELEGKSNEILPPGVVVAYFHLLTQFGQVNQAEKIFSYLRRYHPYFEVDLFKIIDHACCLVSHNRIEDAYKFLVENNVKEKSMKVTLKNNERNCWNLLNSLANLNSPKAPEYTNKFFQLLCDLQFCNPYESKVICGPLVRVHLNRKDFHAATDAYLECLRKYSKAPLQLELVCALLNESSSNAQEEIPNLLEQVLKSTSNIYGLKSSLSLLAVALAIEGHRKTLFHFLKTSGESLTLEDKTILMNFKGLAETGRVDALIHFFEAFYERDSAEKDLFFPLLECILDGFRINSDCKGALEFWSSHLEEKNLINHSLKRKLKLFLKSYDHFIPESLK